MEDHKDVLIKKILKKEQIIEGTIPFKALMLNNPRDPNLTNWHGLHFRHFASIF